MGRNRKKGLDFFPFDVDFFEDIKVRKLIKYQSAKAVTVYALLLCIIYKDGYYIRWDEELPFIISEKTGYEEGYIKEVIKCLAQLGLIDSAMFEHGVLTSRSIQERYHRICIDARRCCDILEYNLISSEEMQVLSEEMEITHAESTQSKEKESKVKNSKEDIESEDVSCDNPPIPAISVEFEVPKSISRKELKDTLQKRTEEFYQSLVPYLGEFSKEMLRNFYNHWSEPNKSKTKMRWEMEKTWDLHRRLLKWQSNDDKWSKSSQQKRGMTILEAVSSVQPVPQMALETIDVKQLIGED